MPLWWQDEDASGRPVDACEVCGKPKDPNQQEREREDAMAADADAAYERLHRPGAVDRPGAQPAPDQHAATVDDLCRQST